MTRRRTAIACAWVLVAVSTSGCLTQNLWRLPGEEVVFDDGSEDIIGYTTIVEDRDLRDESEHTGWGIAWRSAVTPFTFAVDTALFPFLLFREKNGVFAGPLISLLARLALFA